MRQMSSSCFHTAGSNPICQNESIRDRKVSRLDLRITHVFPEKNMLTAELREKVNSYIPVKPAIIHELEWYFHLRRQGYSKRLARLHAIYHIVSQCVDDAAFDIWCPGAEPDEIELDDIDVINFDESEESDEYDDY